MGKIVSFLESEYKDVMNKNENGRPVRGSRIEYTQEYKNIIFCTELAKSEIKNKSRVTKYITSAAICDAFGIDMQQMAQFSQEVKNMINNQ